MTEYLCALMTGVRINQTFDGSYYATFPPFADLSATGSTYEACYDALEAQLTAEVLRRMERGLDLPAVYGIPTPTLDVGDLYDVSS